MTPQTQKLLQLVSCFPKIQVSVVGDLILDSYLECAALGVANEAPVPFLEISGQTHALGGAANVANNMARLGVKTVLAGVVGSDKEAELLCDLVKKAGIEFHPLVTERPTTRKTRVLAGGHYYLRLDDEDATPLDNRLSQILIQQVSEPLQRSQILLVSDYDKGMLKGSFAADLGAMAETAKLRIVGDIKPQNMPYWKKLYGITPNLSEARMLYSSLHPGSPCPESPVELAQLLGQTLSCSIVLKMSDKGVIAIAPMGTSHSFPALCLNPKNVAGAGDTLVAVLAAALSCNADWHDAALLANLAASIAVSHEGTYAVPADELSKAIQNHDIDAPENR